MFLFLCERQPKRWDKEEKGENSERRKEPRRGSIYKEQQESGQPPSKSRSELAHEGGDKNNSWGLLSRGGGPELSPHCTLIICKGEPH